MRRTLSTVLLLGLALPATAFAPQTDTPPDHGTPQGQPHGTVPSARRPQSAPGTTAKQPTHHHRKRRPTPGTSHPTAVSQGAHATPQTPEAAPQPPHATPQ